MGGDMKGGTIITGHRNVVGRSRRRVDSDEDEEEKE